MTRFAASVSYDGAMFHGWQAQQHTTQTVAYFVEKALSKILDHPVDIVCAGRTDAGVHALSQTIHFDGHHPRTLSQLRRGANSLLPPAIRFNQVSVVDDAFHARFSAQARHYRYWCRSDQHPIWRQRMSLWSKPVEADKLHEAAAYLIGERNFQVFRTRECQAKHARRRIFHCQWQKHPSDQAWCLEIIANGFLHHMVRFIAGATLAVGAGDVTMDVFKEAVDTGVRHPRMPCMPATGLYFVKAYYPSACQWVDPPLFDPITYLPIADQDSVG